MQRYFKNVQTGDIVENPDYLDLYELVSIS